MHSCAGSSLAAAKTEARSKVTAFAVFSLPTFLLSICTHTDSKADDAKPKKGGSKLRSLGVMFGLKKNKEGKQQGGSDADKKGESTTGGEAVSATVPQQTQEIQQTHQQTQQDEEGEEEHLVCGGRQW